MKELRDRILKDVKVEMLDEFDKNFDRKAFFNEPWPKRKTSFGRGTLLAVTNRLRRSFRGRTGSDNIRFTSDAQYAALHNTGGEIRVTPRMRAYFWAMYYKKSGQMSTGKNGKASKSQRNVALSTEAEFYKNMALTRAEKIVMPKRQIVGHHPKVVETVDRVAKRAIREYAENTLLPILKK